MASDAPKKDLTDVLLDIAKTVDPTEQLKAEIKAISTALYALAGDTGEFTEKEKEEAEKTLRKMFQFKVALLS